MGTVNIHSKPEADVFQYAFAEDIDGKLVKVSFDNIKKLLNYISADDSSSLVSWMESIDGGIKVTMKDGNTFELPISQAKEFETVAYDTETHYLHFYDADGNDVYEPVYIEGGGGGGSSASSVVKLINHNGGSSFSVSKGASAYLYVEFISTESDIPTGNVTCQITVNGAVKSTLNLEQGLHTLDVGEYLKSGSNTVRVKCTDIYGVSKTLVYTISAIDMYITSTFDASVPYTGDITFKYTPFGAIDKNVYMYIDGDLELNTIITTSGKQNTYIISGLTHGVHRLEMYATATVGTDDIESDHLVYDIMCLESGNTSPMISMVCSTDEIKEGGQVTIPWIVYDPTKLSCDVTLDIYTKANGSDAVYYTQNLTVDRSRQYWNTRKYPVGEVYFRVTYGDISKSHKITVSESDIRTEVETNDLELSLTSEGRSNGEANPAVWTYGDYSAVFHDFNWRTNGWIADENGDTCLRCNDKAGLKINFCPFDNDIRTYGKTIELEFAVRDVNSRDDVIIECMDGGIGFEITADTAYLASEQSRVFCKYKDEEKVRLTFTVEARSEYRQLSVYLNGILSDVIQYPDNDNFQQHDPNAITIRSNKCGIDLYTIRSYSTALPAPTNVDNLIADTRDIVEKTEVFERNDIYDEYGNISFEKCKEQYSIMTIIGDLPQSKGDKKNCVVQYMDIDDPSINFTDEFVVNDVQGTSSQYYVRKNWKLKFSDNRYIDRTQLPAKVMCVKVDYAEATGTHNTQNANFVETLYSEPTPAQSRDPKCRTTIYGKPILLFHQQDAGSDPVFYGKANYNYDKGAEYVFGFTSDHDVECWEFKNNTSAACNFLGSVPTNWGDDFEARYPEGTTNITRFRLMHEWVVSTKDNLEKFKMEFEDYFDLHYCLIYYVYTFFALMVDQRAKNMFLTYWGETGKWQPWFYDNDTSFGINNEGQLVFDYYHEDTDQLNDANVYNGQNSVLWTNFRQAYADEIKETYQNLRNNGLITYDKLVDRFITNGSDKWSETIYNEDSDFKYISMLRSDNDASNLPQVRGSGEEHFRYFVENRLNYCDSKWYASDYANDYISLRIYTPTTWSGVEPNPTITVTPFSDMYAGVRYKANGTLYQERVTHGVPVSFSPQGETFESENNETFNDTETAVYGAHQLSSIGDLAPLYCGSVNVSKADKLIELKVGDGTSGYSNNNLHELSVGTNKLLKKIDVQNCPNFTSVLDLSNCSSIEEVYAKGSGITGVNLPETGTLRKIQLPATIANLTLKHQPYINQISLDGYDAIKTLWVENCPKIDGFDILSKSPNVERLRLTSVNLAYDTAAEMLELAGKSIAGIDENGTNIDKMWIDGKCHIKALTGDELKQVNEAFPYLTITYDALTSYLTFMSEDGSTQLARVAVQNGGDGVYTGSTPSKASTAQYTYTFAGWSLTPGGSANSNAIKNVEADRTVYAAFTSSVRTYTVRFYNGTTLLQTVNNVPYGGTATYTGSTPTNNSTGNTADFQFYGWSPSPANIQGNTDCYAQFNDLREITDDWATIKSKADAGTATYGVGAFKTLDIGAKDMPYDFNGDVAAVLLNGEIHILGGKNSADMYSHYKLTNGEWVYVSKMPYAISDTGTAVVYNNEIHMFGRSGGSYNRHYKFSDGNWISVSTLPYNFTGSPVVYDNEIHILGSSLSSGMKYHYKWTGTEWISVSTLPYEFSKGSAVVYNDEIHILGSSTSGAMKYHYKWTGSEWISVSTLPYDFYQGCAVVYNNEIRIIGGYNSSSSRTKYHYKWNGSSWTSVGTLPYGFYEGCSVIFEDKIHILGSASDSSCYRNFYAYSSETSTWSKAGITERIPMQLVATNHDDLPDGVSKWEALTALGLSHQYGCAVTYRDEVHVLGGDVSVANTQHLKWNATNSAWVSVSTLPHKFRGGCAVVLNDELHILGSYQTTNRTEHYKWNGTEWTSVSTLPYSFCQASAVVYNNEIHIIGSYTSGVRNYHYKWNGTEWASVSTLPYNFYYGSAVVYNNEIHILGSNTSSYYKAHYKWNGTEWASVSTLPHNFQYGAAGVINNEIHIFGGEGNAKGHYKWTGTEWISVSTLPASFQTNPFTVCDNTPYLFINTAVYKPTTTRTEWSSLGELPYDFYNGSTLIHNNELHILGGQGVKTNHYKWDGSSWTSVSTLPYEFYYGSAIVYNGEIHIIGAGTSTYRKNHYKWNGSSWTSVSTLPYDFIQGSTVIFNNELHILGSGNAYAAYHYKWNGTEWTSVSTIPYSFYLGGAVVHNGEIHLLGGSSKNKYHYKWNGSSWTSVSTLPYAFTECSSIVYNNEIHLIGGSSSGRYHCKWNGSSWTDMSALPYTIASCSVTFYNDQIALLGGSGDNNRKFMSLITIRPKASLTFIAKNLLSKTRKLHSSAVSGGWPVMSLRTWLNNDFLSTLPSDLQTALTEVRKLSDGGLGSTELVVTNDKVWIPSCSEITSEELTYTINGQGLTYSVFTDDTSRIKYQVGASTASYWVTRSQKTTGTSPVEIWVTNKGKLGSGNGISSSNHFILIGFCI